MTFLLAAHAQSTELHQPGLDVYFKIHEYIWLGITFLTQNLPGLQLSFRLSHLAAVGNVMGHPANGN